jgi:hypothetical protein
MCFAWCFDFSSSSSSSSVLVVLVLLVAAAAAAVRCSLLAEVHGSIYIHYT